MTKETTPGFRICDNRGFHITFENGITLSVQFGWGNYCRNKGNLSDPNWAEYGKKAQESPDAEIAIWNKHGEWITEMCPTTKDADQVIGYITPDQVAEIIDWAVRQPEDITPSNKEESHYVSSDTFCDEKDESISYVDEEDEE